MKSFERTIYVDLQPDELAQALVDLPHHKIVDFFNALDPSQLAYCIRYLHSENALSESALQCMTMIGKCADRR